jgi:glyoxylase-like metal-dependent hydrolase (beta-lactamase superfamily II)
VPLPNNPLRELNSYLLVGGAGRPLLVDLGFDMSECHNALEQGLSQLDLGFEDIDVFITHGHPDHCGCIARILRPEMRVFAGFPSSVTLQERLCQEFRGFLRWTSGRSTALQYRQPLEPMSEMERMAYIAKLRAVRMTEIVTPSFEAPVTVLSDGDTLSAGGRDLRVVAVQGHSPDHLWLYDADRGLLIAGDQVLPSITPNLAEFSIGENVLSRYLASFDALADLDVSLVLPGHREPYANLPARLKELHEHHERRAFEVQQAVEQGNNAVVSIARSVTWKNPIPDWDDWPMKQQFFAIGETLAHLSYLESQGRIGVNVENDRVTFHA